jgi:hypothetical protein
MRVLFAIWFSFVLGYAPTAAIALTLHAENKGGSCCVEQCECQPSICCSSKSAPSPEPATPVRTSVLDLPFFGAFCALPITFLAEKLPQTPPSSPLLEAAVVPLFLRHCTWLI